MAAWATHAIYIENDFMKILLTDYFCRSEQKTNRTRMGFNHQPFG